MTGLEISWAITKTLWFIFAALLALNTLDFEKWLRGLSEKLEKAFFVTVGVVFLSAFPLTVVSVIWEIWS